MLLHRLRLPYPLYLVRILRRTAATWILVKMLIFAIFLVVDGIPAYLFPTYGIPALLVWIDRRAAHELLLPANLGASEAWLIVPAVILCLTLDWASSALLG